MSSPRPPSGGALALGTQNPESLTAGSGSVLVLTLGCQVAEDWRSVAELVPGQFFSGVKRRFFEAGQSTCQEKPCHFPQAVLLTLSISQPG